MKTTKGVPYAISFDTQEMPGKLVAVTVELTKRLMGPDDKMSVALVEHPLYRHLENYVLANPSAARRAKAS